MQKCKNISNYNIFRFIFSFQVNKRHKKNLGSLTNTFISYPLECNLNMKTAIAFNVKYWRKYFKYFIIFYYALPKTRTSITLLYDA